MQKTKRGKTLRRAIWHAAQVLLMTVVAAWGAAAAETEPVRHWSPEELWQGVDVENLPLEVEVLRSWDEDDCSLQKLTFVSEVADGVKIRVYGIQGAPKGATGVPGILHIHGGGQ